MESSITAPEKKAGRPKKLLNDAVGPVVDVELPSGVQKEIVKDDDYNLEVIKDYYGNVDPFYLSKKDPRYEYRFLRADDKNLSMATGNLLFNYGGWQLCGVEHLKRIGVHDRFISPDGHYRVGDTILAFMPKNLYDEKMKMERKKSDDWMRAIEERSEKGESVSGIHESMKGIQTERDLNGNWKS